MVVQSYRYFADLLCRLCIIEWSRMKVCTWRMCYLFLTCNYCTQFHLHLHLSKGRFISSCTTGFLHQYNWNIVESGVKHHNHNPNTVVCSCFSFPIRCVIWFNSFQVNTTYAELLQTQMKKWHPCMKICRKISHGFGNPMCVIYIYVNDTIDKTETDYFKTVIRPTVENTYITLYYQIQHDHLCHDLNVKRHN